MPIHTILEPNATPRDNFILSLTETATAVVCSTRTPMLGCRKIEVRDGILAAFPTIGKRMRPTNDLPIWPLEVRPLMESTRNSAVIATSYSAPSDPKAVKEISH